MTPNTMINGLQSAPKQKIELHYGMQSYIDTYCCCVHLPCNGSRSLSDSIPGQELGPGSLGKQAVVKLLHQMILESARKYICTMEIQNVTY